MTEIHLSDPWDLTPAEQSKLDRLLALHEKSLKDFDDQVRKIATDGDPQESDMNVLCHPEIAEASLESLSRMIGAAQAARKNERNKAIQQLLDHEVKQLGRTRHSLKPRVHRAIFLASQGSPRHRAEKALGKAYRRELEMVQKDIDAGMSVKDAAARAWERRNAGA